MTGDGPMEGALEVSSDRAMIGECLREALASRDPSTRVGAILVDRHGRKIAAGHNGFPDRIPATRERLADRETKLRLTVHAELAAILDAARRRTDPFGTTLYIAALDRDNRILGLPPCVNCAIHCIAAGIDRVIWPDAGPVPARWKDEIDRSLALFEEAGVGMRCVRVAPVADAASRSQPVHEAPSP